MSTRTRQDWVLWAQLGCALVATMHAEYTLALATGLHWSVAGAVPGALDLYVIRALQKHKDVLPAVLVMVAANVASILVARGVLAVGWGVLAAVGALAPLLVWRGHVLRVHAGAVKAPVPEPVPDVLDVLDVLDCRLSEPFLRPLDESCSECGGRWGDHPGVQAKRAVWEARYAAPDRVPDWMADEYPVGTQVEYAEYSEYEDKWERVQGSVPYPFPVPALPPEFESVPDAGTAPDPGVLQPGDHEYTALAQEYIGTTDAPTIRGMRRHAGVGQDRAIRLLKHLGVKS